VEPKEIPMPKTGTVIRARNFLIEELGELNPEKQARVRGVLEGFMRDVREHLKTVEEIASLAEISCPTPCPTCAFNPKTDGLKGFAPTAYGLARTIHLGNRFYCHKGQRGHKHNLIDLSKVEVCMGYALVMVTRPDEAKKLADAAMDEIRAIVDKE
jgi:hypothetical protein